ncbi:MAG: PAC2 family protein [Thermoproteota archaeon]
MQSIVPGQVIQGRVRMLEKQFTRIYVKDLPLMETKIWIRRGIGIVNPVVIIGLPGLGRIGGIISRYLIKRLNTKLVGIVTSPYFSNQVIVSKKGIARITGVRMYKSGNTLENSDLIIVTADEHLENIWGEYDIAIKLLRFLIKKGVRLIVTVGGHVSSTGSKGVIGFASNEQLLKRLEEAGCRKAEMGTPVVGLSGIILGLSSIMGVDAVCILGETISVRPDAERSREVLNVLNKFLGLNIDISDFQREEEKINEIISRYESKVKQLIQDEKARKIAEAFMPPDYVS